MAQYNNGLQRPVKNRTLEAYCCLRGLENEVTSDFCLAPYLKISIKFLLAAWRAGKIPKIKPTAADVPNANKKALSEI